MIICWLDINSSYSHSNLAFPALHSMLKQEYPIEWVKVNGTINTQSSEIMNLLIDYKPDIILATAWLFNHEYLTSIIQDYKAIYQQTRVILGGPEFLGTPIENENYLRSRPYIDYVFRGEGEEVFDKMIKNLVETHDTSNKLNPHQGLCFISSDGDYIDGGLAQVENFEEVSAPESSHFFDWSKSFVQLETSRGCFNTCSFCISGIKNKLQDLPLKTLRTRLEYIYNRGIREIRILDRTFNAKPKRALELLELFEEYNQRLRFHLEVHPAYLSKDVEEKLYTLPTDLIHIEVGVQSLDDNVLRASCRLGSKDDTIDGITKLLNSGKFEVHSDLIIGLPEYSYQQLIKDTLFLIGLKVSEIQIETLKCLPGTNMRNQSKELGLHYSPTPPYEILQTKWIDYTHICKAMTLSSIIDQWYNKHSNQNLFKKLIEQGGEDFLTNMIDYYFKHAVLGKIMSKESRFMLLYDYCEEHFPELTNLVSIAWAEAGLSMKKRPAEKFKHWTKDSQIENPLLDNSRPTYNYFYIDSAFNRVWLCFDRADRSLVKTEGFKLC